MHKRGFQLSDSFFTDALRPEIIIKAAEKAEERTPG